MHGLATWRVFLLVLHLCLVTSVRYFGTGIEEAWAKGRQKHVFCGSARVAAEVATCNRSLSLENHGLPRLFPVVQEDTSAKPIG